MGTDDGLSMSMRSLSTIFDDLAWFLCLSMQSSLIQNHRFTKLSTDGAVGPSRAGFLGCYRRLSRLGVGCLWRLRCEIVILALYSQQLYVCVKI